MSFILDALKKSESDRQRQSSPGIASVPVGGSPGRSPRWLPVVLVLLAVNLVAVVVLLVRPAVPPSTAATAPAGGQPVRDVAVPAGSTIPVRSEPDTDEPAPSGRSLTVVAEPVPETAAAEHREPDRTPAAEVQPASASAAAAASPAATPADDDSLEEPYLTINELRASGAVNLPELHIDLHVYSDNPGERFVFINMTQYRENSTLDAGPRVRRITPDGVVLEYRGSTFLLPRD